MAPVSYTHLDVYKRQLQVQAGVLIQVPGGGVLLRPEDGTDLKDPLEGAHHSLLIELGGLGEKCLAPEVVQPEDVAAPLGPGVDDLCLLYTSRCV